MARKAEYRTVFISDVHLGCSEARAVEATTFLKHIRCETLYLVGDIIDMWCLKKKWHWPDANNRFLRRVLKMAQKGTRVVFIPGNHDEAARAYAGLSFGGVRIELSQIHTTADGKRLLVIHGDEYDMIVKHAPLLSALGGSAYDQLLRINRHFNNVRRWIGMDYWSLSKSIKLKVKGACKYVSSYEQALIAHASAMQVDGVVCGHVHKAEARSVGAMMYYNCGDWVEDSTALVEHHDGRIELVDGVQVVKQLAAQFAAPVELAGVAGADRSIFHPLTSGRVGHSAGEDEAADLSFEPALGRLAVDVAEGDSAPWAWPDGDESDELELAGSAAEAHPEGAKSGSAQPMISKERVARLFAR